MQKLKDNLYHKRRQLISFSASISNNAKTTVAQNDVI